MYVSLLLSSFHFELLSVMPVIQTLYERAHEYANLANRATPVAKDVLLACDERGLKGRDLHNIALASESIGQYGPQKLGCNEPFLRCVNGVIVRASATPRAFTGTTPLG
jgi:hypothetical protein